MVYYHPQGTFRHKPTTMAGSTPEHIEESAWALNHLGDFLQHKTYSSPAAPILGISLNLGVTGDNANHGVEQFKGAINYDA